MKCLVNFSTAPKMCDPSLLVFPTSFYLRVVPSVVRQTIFQPKVMKNYQQKKLHADLWMLS